MFANDVTDKELLSKVYKQIIQLNIKKINNSPFEKGAEVLNMQFFSKKIHKWPTDP